MSKKIEEKNLCGASFREMLNFNIKNELSCADSRMLMCLMSNYDHEKKVTAIRQEDIRDQTGVSLSSVRNSTNKLKEKKIIKVSKAQSDGKSHVFNNYSIHKKLQKWFKLNDRKKESEQVI
jgi:DNA-binding MarR family transcriptional regulator